MGRKRALHQVWKYSFSLFLSSFALFIGGCNTSSNTQFISFSAPNTRIGNLEAQCLKGDGRKCLKIGEIYYWGKGISPQKEKGAQLWEEGCKKGNGVSCVLEGILYWRGEPFSQDKELALHLFGEGCKKGSGWGCVMEGIGLSEMGEKNREKINNLFQEGCKKGALIGCWLEEPEKEGSKRDPQPLLKDALFSLQKGAVEKAKGKGEKLCGDKNGKGCILVATLLLWGVGKEWDPDRGVKLYRQSCYDFRNGDGCYLLGKLYSEGIWVEENYWRVLHLFRRGCKLNSPFACKELP